MAVQGFGLILAPQKSPFLVPLPILTLLGVTPGHCQVESQTKQKE